MSAFTYQSMYEHELKALLQDRIEQIKQELSLGFLTNYEEYKMQAGKIAGLRDALDLMDEADRVCSHKAR